MSRNELERRGENLFFSQRHGAPWESLPYWEGAVDYNGCGLVAMTMCIDILTGRELTPEDVYRMRDSAGIDQRRVCDREATSICGGDAQLRFNEMNRRLFGIESRPLERSAEAFRTALSGENTVIWASSRQTGFYDIRGNKRKVRTGHVLCFWKYDRGVFYAKDPGLTKELGNNVPYDTERLCRWLDAWDYQQFEIGLPRDKGKEKESI